MAACRAWASAIPQNTLHSPWGLTGWVRNEYDGTVLLEIQGSEYMINKLLMGLNHNQFITIEWMDTEELPLDKEEKSFSVR